jgi:mannose-6-phosphate isomerase-like protein (cupin superfamily)
VRLILVRDMLPLASHREESQTLYMVSGEAALTIGDTVQTLLPGWVGVVPRTVPYSLQKKGRNPAVLLSVTAGQPC